MSCTLPNPTEALETEAGRGVRCR